jgi:predicted negative regulator of RcsB-dependent stress response
MWAIFDKIENSMDKPQQPNLRAFIDKKVAGAAVLTSISVDKALVAVALDTDMEWNTIKAHLRMV